MLVCSVLRISRFIDNEVSSRWLHYISAAIFIYHRCTPTWRFRTGFCKFRRISEFWETHRPKTWRSVLYSYHNFWAFSTGRFSTYLLRDSENDLFGKSRKREVWIAYSEANPRVVNYRSSSSYWEVWEIKVPKIESPLKNERKNL